MQMFIAVINENFSVAEEAKRTRQATLYFRTQEPDKHRPAWVRKLNPYRWFKPSPRAIVVENLPSNLVLPMQKALVQEYGGPVPERRPSRVSSLPVPQFRVSNPEFGAVGPRSAQREAGDVCTFSRTTRLVCCRGCSSVTRSRMMCPLLLCSTPASIVPRRRNLQMERQMGTCEFHR